VTGQFGKHVPAAAKAAIDFWGSYGAAEKAVETLIADAKCDHRG